MKIYRNLETFYSDKGAVVTIGSFDGVHHGHQYIIDKLCKIAKQSKYESVVVTFWPHPRAVLYPDKKLYLLSDLEEKIDLLSLFSIDHLLIIPFNKNFANTKPCDFIKEILIKKLNTVKLVVGYNHRFGKDGEGDFKYLKANSLKFGFDIEEIPKQEIRKIDVSSSKIRKILFKGKVDIASKFLGRNYEIRGKVVKGKQIGRMLGFPTANIIVNESSKLIPCAGIYAVNVLYKNQWYQGMMSIGKNPTISDNLSQSLEVNIFNFNQNIYDEKIIVRFKKYVRAEKKFPNLRILKENILHDKIVINSFFQSSIETNL